MGAVQQSGNVTPGHLATWVTDGVLKDGGPAIAGQRVLASLRGANSPNFDITSFYMETKRSKMTRWQTVFCRAFFVLSIVCSPVAHGQSVQQSGNVTPGHVPVWVTDGVVSDGGTAAQGNLSSLGITASGPSFCLNSDRTTAAGYQQFCFGVTTANGGAISVQNFGTAASKPFAVTVNGTTYQFPFTTTGVVGPVSTTVGHLATWNNTTGTLLADSGNAAVVGPVSTTVGHLVTWNNTSGSLLADSGGIALTTPGTLTIGDILAATGATALGRIADVAVGSVFASGGVGTAPAWLANAIGLNGAAGQNFISGEPGYILELINDNSAFQEMRVSTYGAAPTGGENNVHWVRMDGSAASPTNTKTGMFFFSFGTRGNDGQVGAAGNTGSSGAVQSYACSNWTSTDHCTQFHWEVTPTGTTTRTNKMDLVNGGLALTGAVWQGGGYITDATGTGITISCGRILGGLLERAAGAGAPFTDTTATAQQIVQCANTQGGGPGNGANVPIHTYFIYSNRSGQTATLAGGTGVTIGSASGLTISNGTAAMWEVIIENSTLSSEAVRLYRTN